MKKNWLRADKTGPPVFSLGSPDRHALALPLGVLVERQETEPIHYIGRAHIFCVAPSGAGKSQALAIPALLTWQHAAIVLDVKGELYFQSAGYRGNKLGQKVYRFDPSDPETAKFNPLEFIDRDPFAIEQSIADIADVIVPVPPDTRDPFFLRSAQQVLQTALHFLAWQSDQAVKMEDFLQRCYDLEEFKSALNKLGSAPPQDGLPDSVRFLARSIMSQFFDAEGELTKTGQSVWAELINHLAPLNTAQIRNAASSSDWSPGDLRDGKATLYLTLSPRAKGQYRAILALVMNTHLGELMRIMPDKDDAPILLLLDEMPQLGHMKAIEQVIDLGRGYGLLLYGFAQRRKQIEASYGDAGDFLGTFQARAYMNPSPEDGSAAMLSKAIGENTKVVGKDTKLVPEAPENELCGQEFSEDIIVLSRGNSPARIRKCYAYKDKTLAPRLALSAPAMERYAPAGWSPDQPRAHVAEDIDTKTTKDIASASSPKRRGLGKLLRKG